eukprot:g3182.t1
MLSTALLRLPPRGLLRLSTAVRPLSSSSPPSSVVVVATLDSKGEEAAFVTRAALANNNNKNNNNSNNNDGSVVVVDVSCKPASAEAVAGAAAVEAAGASVVVPAADLLSRGDFGEGGTAVTPAEVAALPRGEANDIMKRALASWLAAAHADGGLGAVLGLGGSGGTALATGAMRDALPVGVPKLMVSTMAGGDVSAYVGVSDIVMMPSVVDVAGINTVSAAILGNAARAAAGMAAAAPATNSNTSSAGVSKPTVGLSMFGVTTPLCDSVRTQLEAALDVDVLVFHATGTGGRAMESLVRSGLLDGVVDLTTTEVCDLLHGGVLACSEDRLEAAIDAGVPLVVSVGALDMVNYGNIATVPPALRDEAASGGRQLFEHNSEVTLLRTTAEEAAAAASFIASKLNRSSSSPPAGASASSSSSSSFPPWTVLMPGRGVSLLDSEGQAFYDPAATAAIHETLARELVVTQQEQEQEQDGDSRVLRVVDADINDEAFASAVVEEFTTLWRRRRRSGSGAMGRAGSGAGGAGSGSQQQQQQQQQRRSFSSSSSSSSSSSPPHAMDRGAILGRLRAQVAAGEPIVGAGAGTGLSAKAAVDGGADLIIIYNSGRYRMAGRGSLAGLLPYGDANAIVLEMAAEVGPVIAASGVPLIAGVCGTDPFRSMPGFLGTLRRPEYGFHGVQNFPTVGLIDGTFRANLEETGMGFGLEVEMIAEARRQGLLTTPYAFTPEEAEAMARAGADIVVAHCGLTTGGSIGAETAMTLDEAADAVGAMARAAKRGGEARARAQAESAQSSSSGGSSSASSSSGSSSSGGGGGGSGGGGEGRGLPLVLCHGGPISEPDDAALVLERCAEDGVVGFYGASSMERLPVEVAIRDTVGRFKDLRL